MLEMQQIYTTIWKNSLILTKSAFSPVTTARHKCLEYVCLFTEDAFTYQCRG